MTDNRDRTTYSRHYRTLAADAPIPQCTATLDTHQCQLDAGHTTPHATMTRRGERGTVARWT